MACEPADGILMVAAIDFGTTYSGYAFSTRHGFSIDKLDIKANQVWNAGSKQLLSLKTPTCILLKKNKEFVSFGYVAENDYAGIVTDQEEKDYFFFQNFKMMLYHCENLTLKTTIEDIRGQSLPAIDVFSASIKALRDHLHETLKTATIDIQEDEIKWVLTVPAIWSDPAKKFMRKSAEKAGIQRDRLIIALEPEDASIYCQCLPVDNLQGGKEGFSNIQKGTKYMVVDLGGGTVDITAHEKLGEHKIAELCKATGDDCGGTSVDKEFLQILYDVVGKDVINKMKKEDVESYLDLCRAFESTKRNLRLNNRSKVNITIPFVALNGLCQTHHRKNFATKLSESKYAGNISLFKDRLCIDLEFMKSLFQKTIDRIIGLIKSVLTNKNADGVSTILLVGGFSECHLAQEAIRHSFSDKTIISPENPSLAVLKGAVIFGHMPNFIDSRCVRRTYGRRIKPVFDSTIYDRSREVSVDGENRCEGVFEPFMTVNKSIKAGTEVKLEYHTIERRAEKINVAIYVTEEEVIPKYVDDKGCRKLGEFVVNIPNPTDERRYVLVQFTFGDTEIRAKAMERDSKATYKATLKLL